MKRYVFYLCILEGKQKLSAFFFQFNRTPLNNQPTLHSEFIFHEIFIIISINLRINKQFFGKKNETIVQYLLILFHSQSCHQGKVLKCQFEDKTNKKLITPPNLN